MDVSYCSFYTIPNKPAFTVAFVAKQVNYTQFTACLVRECSFCHCVGMLYNESRLASIASPQISSAFPRYCAYY